MIGQGITIKNIGIVIPAHNEAEHITACLTAINTAIKQLPPTICATVLVVLDSCEDDTQKLVDCLGAASLACAFRCVGQVLSLIHI